MESMDRSTLAQQVESVERNVAFLQQEHRILLSGLRLEIRNLKKQCSELSCELSERPPVRSREGEYQISQDSSHSHMFPQLHVFPDIDLEEELLQARLLETEQHLAEQESALVELRAELRKKGALASALQVRLQDEERRFLEELKRRSHKITTLSCDLRKQTDLAAQLSFQLHSAHFRLYHQTEEYEEEDEEEEDEGGTMQVGGTTAGFICNLRLESFLFFYVYTDIRMDCKFSVDISSNGGKCTSKPSFRKDAEISKSEGMRAPRKGAWARRGAPHA
uniref:Coiled-coil domain-containing protein 92-like n=1 Tax=Sinocyclocheilus rhinocerous TaxID=307959 RepID=A0A673IVF7_9TELE